MSKEKLLASAQKNLEKGQIAKAIGDYRKVVAADPRDMRNRQKLAELLSRARQTEEALAEYGTVAKYFADNGFNLKAIAVFKQMQRLDPDRPDLYLRLAELNQKQGLVGNAAAEYRNLVGLYEGQKKFPDAIGVLEKMKDLEPDNVNVRIRIIETCLRGGSRERARREFDEVLEFLREKGESARSLPVYGLLLPQHPHDEELKIGYGEMLVRHGDVDQGMQLLQPLTIGETQNPRAFLLLAEGYRRKGEAGHVRSTLQRGIDTHPDHLELREAFIRILLDAGEFPLALQEVGCRFDTFAKGRREALQEFCRALQQALPEDPQAQRLLSRLEGKGDSPAPVDAEDDLSLEELFPALNEVEEAIELNDLPVLTAAEPENRPAAPSDLAEPDPPLTAADGEEEAAEFSLAELSFSEDSLADAERGPVIELLAPVMAEGDIALPPSLEVAADPSLELELELDLDLEVEIDGFPADAVCAPVVGEEGIVAPPPLCPVEEAPEEAGELAALEALRHSLVDSAPSGPEAEEELCLDLDGGEDPPEDEAGIDLRTLLAEEDDVSAAAMPEAPGRDVPSRQRGGIRTDAVELEDAESHFQLGIAYKEMGLLEEAEKEFAQAMRDPSRAAACLALKGICLAVRGKAEEAEAAFKAGLRHPGLAENEKLSLYFELGDLYEQGGRLLDALDCFQYVADHDLFLRQVGERIASLRRRLGLDGGDQEGEEAGPQGNRKRVSYI